jgi:putative tryptophan/tyrosine transport system substrate-binding protein
MKMHRLVLIIIAAALFFVLPLQAQTAKLYRIGFLSPGGFGSGTVPGRLSEEIARQLAQGGFTVGANLELVKRGAEGHFERLPALVAELVLTKVDVIVTFSYPTAAAAKEGTSTIPIVIFNAGDPVKTHLVDSLNRPGGNIIGISDVAAELAPKRLGLLKEAAPKLQRVAMLWNAKDLGMTTRYEASAAAAKELGVAVLSFGVGEPNDFGDAFEAMERDKPDGLLMVADALTFLNRKHVFDFAAEHRLPAIYESSAFARDGGLMSYGPDEKETAEHGANLVLRVLKGQKPADLPLEQPTRFRLIVNLKTAKALGLTVPPGLLVAADEVIE